MRRSLLLIAVLAVGIHGAIAGLIIVQEADQLGPMSGKTKMTMSISGERARVDVGDQLSSIVDLSGGTVTSLMHAQKIAMQLPKAAVEAFKQKAAVKTGKPDLKPTGKKETISGYACEEYTGTLQGLNVTYWVTKDVPDQKEILAEMAKAGGGANPFKGAMADGADFPGFPIRTTVASPQFGNSTMTVVSIQHANVPDSLFQVPADYKSMALPQTPAVPPAGP
jgi:hypothetical protein